MKRESDRLMDEMKKLGSNHKHYPMLKRRWMAKAIQETKHELSRAKCRAPGQ